MSIHYSLSKSSTLEAARGLSMYGISVIPAVGKKAASTWKLYQQRRASLREVDAWFSKPYQQLNLAIVCGAVSRNLVVMDCDGWPAVHEFEERFPALLNTLTILTGSGQGKHYYFFTRSPRTVRAKGFELRGDGCYVIAPPSQHPVSLACYSVERDVEPLFVPDLSELWAWIAAKQQRDVKRYQAPTRPAAASSTIKNPNAYARAALMRESETVQRAGEGNRNNALYGAALRMGNFVQLGWIMQSIVEAELLFAAAALVASDGAHQTKATIRSGIETGMQREQRGLG